MVFIVSYKQYNSASNAAEGEGNYEKVTEKMCKKL